MRLLHIGMKVIAQITFYLLLFHTSYAQKDLSVQYARTITTEDLREHLNILASDALEGRETGERGQKMAAAYIEFFFKENQLEPIVNTASGSSFLQSFDLLRVKPGKTWIKFGDELHENFTDFVYTGKSNFTEPEKAKLMFIGPGNNDDYKAVNVVGRNVLIYSDGNKNVRNKKAELALMMGAKNVFFVQSGTVEQFRRIVRMYRSLYSSNKLSQVPQEDEISIGYFLISMSLASKILQVKEDKILEAVEKANDGKYAALLKIKPSEITFYASQLIEKVNTDNVLALIEGTDKKDEYVIVTAHYDHIGIDGEEINNGADDDGSGTVAVMEMAQAFSKAKKNGHGPRRSILFLTVTGEEKGLLGSEYYVNHPAVPLEKTITNLNIDMIGRVDASHVDNPNYVYLIGSDKLSTELHQLSEHTNATYTNLELDYKYNSKNDPNRYYYRSDHYNFAKNNIPIIFYFNGTHEDYHRPTDTIDKIRFDVLRDRTKLIFHTTWEIANREERISVDVSPEDLNIEDNN